MSVKIGSFKSVNAYRSSRYGTGNKFSDSEKGDETRMISAENQLTLQGTALYSQGHFLRCSNDRPKSSLGRSPLASAGPETPYRVGGDPLIAVLYGRVRR